MNSWCSLLQSTISLSFFICRWQIWKNNVWISRIFLVISKDIYLHIYIRAIVQTTSQFFLLLSIQFELWHTTFLSCFSYFKNIQFLFIHLNLHRVWHYSQEAFIVVKIVRIISNNLWEFVCNLYNILVVLQFPTEITRIKTNYSNVELRN